MPRERTTATRGGEGDISLLPPLLIVNRLGRRHVTNVGELEAFAAAKLGRRFVRRGATTFERARIDEVRNHLASVAQVEAALSRVQEAVSAETAWLGSKLPR